MEDKLKKVLKIVAGITLVILIAFVSVYKYNNTKPEYKKYVGERTPLEMVYIQINKGDRHNEKKEDDLYEEVETVSDVMSKEGEPNQYGINVGENLFFGVAGYQENTTGHIGEFYLTTDDHVAVEKGKIYKMRISEIATMSLPPQIMGYNKGEKEEGVIELSDKAIRALDELDKEIKIKEVETVEEAITIKKEELAVYLIRKTEKEAQGIIEELNSKGIRTVFVEKE